MTTLEQLIHTDNPVLTRILNASSVGRLADPWDNRPTWDNKKGGGSWDNRPTWDNWNNR